MRLGIIMMCLALCAPAAVRVKEIAAIEGVRDNQLIGYGLVVGLNGTGDKRQTVFSSQTLANLLDRMGVQVTPSAILVRNTAAVMVTANLPPFSQPGLRVDVQVAAVGDASNLQGGLLVLTPLKAVDGQVFAVAQGSVVTGGFVAGRGGNSTTLNHPTAGRVPNGAIVERAAPSVNPEGRLRLQLRQADFTTASRLARAINSRFSAEVARCESAGLVSVTVPPEYSSRGVDFIAEVETLTLEADRPQRIIINERTGTIIAGRDIRIRPVAVLHGALSVEVQTSYDVSQPAPFSQGKTATIPQVSTSVQEEKAKSIQLKPGGTVDDLVRALTAIGSTARDVIAILQSLKAAGALDAEIEVI
ncbi:MAG: flagellar basal body P-ring protein FlgI [Acidobacteria bacterium]|nr:flagellar basal body P-ring protein FlgI [Acidobacteriota bacterium]